MRVRPLRPPLPLLLLLLSACGAPDACLEVSPRAPSIEFQESVVDLGRLPPDAPHEVRVPWRHVGTGGLRVLAVESDCGCVVSSWLSGFENSRLSGFENSRLSGFENSRLSGFENSRLSGFVAPGATGSVVVRVRGPRRLGVTSHRVRVFTDQPPPGDIVTFTLRVRSEHDAEVVPHVLDVGRRSPGARMRRDAEIRLAPELGPQADDLTIRLTGIDGDVRVLPPVQGDHPGRLVRMELRAPSSAGDFGGRLLVLRDGALLASARISGWVDDKP